MTREGLIGYCRYYKGEDECPFENSTNEGFFWLVEKKYVQRAVEVGIDEYCKYREGKAQAYIDTHPTGKNIYTSTDVSIHTKGIATYVEDMSAKWLPMQRNKIFDY